MGKKSVLAIRFQAEGAEAELYRKIQEGREASGLSAPEYVKKILLDHFMDGEERDGAEKVLKEIREEYRETIRRVERTVHRSMQEHDAILLGALGRVNGTVASVESDDDRKEDAVLPEEGRDIPEGALDFLDGF